MRDLYLGDLIEGEVYEFWDGTLCYLDKVHDHHCVCYDTKRDNSAPWIWNLHTTKYLKEHIRTILDIRGY